MSEQPSCATCPYWSQPPEGERAGFGHCVRFPPVPVIARLEDSTLKGAGILTRWPETHASDGCGEHPEHAAMFRPVPAPVVDRKSAAIRRMEELAAQPMPEVGPT